jgi:DNA-binding beta-propeller fold protein YncE
MLSRRLLVFAAALAFGACADQDVMDPSNEPSTTGPAFSRNDDDDRDTDSRGRSGAVYVMTNATANAILAFERGSDGALGPSTSFATGGAGSGANLGSQGSIVLTEGGRFLVAVNAGSDEISVFLVKRAGLELRSTVGSGGDHPISVTVSHNRVYALNDGGAGNISGFWLSPDGRLVPIPGSTRLLSGSGTGPAQIEFSPDGETLVVTEKNTNRFLTYEVSRGGQASGPTVHASAGMTPFGFAFAGRNLLLVSEAFGGAVDASAVSSYRLDGNELDLISASVPTTETAACWTVVSKDGRFVYVTNTGSGSISGYAVGRRGRIEILDADGVTGNTGAGSGPLDAAFNVSSRFLYTLNTNGTISAFEVANNGSLSPIAGVTGLPGGTLGIAAH